MQQFILKPSHTTRILFTILFATCITSGIAAVFEGFIGAWIAFMICIYLNAMCLVLFPELSIKANDFHNFKVLYKLMLQDQTLCVNRTLKIKGYRWTKAIINEFFIMIERKNKEIANIHNSGILTFLLCQKISRLYYEKY